MDTLLSHRTTEQVFQSYSEAFQARDLDAIASNYATDAMYLMPDGPHVGREAIRAAFSRIFTDLLPVRSRLDVLSTQIEGDIVVATWEAESPSLTVDWGTDTFIIQGGLIRYHTVVTHSAGE